MTARTTALAASVLLLAVACTDPPCDATLEDGVYLVTSIDLPPSRSVDGAELATGFDVDGVQSSGGFGGDCVELTPDYRALEAPEEDGIDNTAGDLSGSAEMFATRSMHELFEEAIVEGRLTLLVELTAVGGTRRVRVLRGVLADGGVLRLGGESALGQRFRVEEVLADLPARVGCASGVPRIATRTTSFAPAASDVFPALPLERAEVTHLGFEVERGALQRGRLGGSWSLDDLATWTARSVPELDARDVRDLISRLGDLDPDPSNPMTCRRISFGLSFEAVPAELVE